MRQDIETALAEKRRLMSSVYVAWAAMRPTLHNRINLLIDQLVFVDNEEIRGRIKELRELLDFDKKLAQDIEDLENELKAFDESGQTENQFGGLT